MGYGIQLYSVRDSMPKDFEGTLKAVAEMGYKFVEFAGFFDHSAEEVKGLLDKYGLTVSGTHTGLAEMWDNYEATVAYHKTIGNRNIIIPGHDLSSQAKLDDFIAKVNVVQKKLAKDGIQLGYHNHHREFFINSDGSLIEDQLIYRTNMFLEIDTYWAYVGMKDPIALLDRLGDRVHVIHIKDGDAAGNGKPLGMGTAPVDKVYAKALEMKLPMVVESETCTPSGLEEAKICIDKLFSLEK